MRPLTRSRSIAVLVCTLAFSGVAATEPTPVGQPGAPPARPETERQRDERALLEVIARSDERWKKFDAELASRDDGPDADWVNAFGLSKRGKAEIFAFLQAIYQSQSIRSRTSSPSRTTLRFARPDVAIASSYRETDAERRRIPHAQNSRPTCARPERRQVDDF